jgi:hypothetical protein
MPPAFDFSVPARGGLPEPRQRPTYGMVTWSDLGTDRSSCLAPTLLPTPEAPSSWGRGEGTSPRTCRARTRSSCSDTRLPRHQSLWVLDSPWLRSYPVRLAAKRGTDETRAEPANPVLPGKGKDVSRLGQRPLRQSGIVPSKRQVTACSGAAFALRRTTDSVKRAADHQGKPVVVFLVVRRLCRMGRCASGHRTTYPPLGWYVDRPQRGCSVHGCGCRSPSR